ncbi:MAG: alpha-glucan family phosphorylase [Bdellovibrionota bacterium]
MKIHPTRKEMTIGSEASVARVDVPASTHAALEKFLGLAKSNIAWSWRQSLLNMLEDWNPSLWSESDGSPLQFFARLPADETSQLIKDLKILTEIESASRELNSLNETKNPHEIAYFCMEYGLTTSLRLYSGGLGILAGDHLKTANDLSWPLCAVGLAYRKGYFRQRLDEDGKQIAEEVDNHFDDMPMLPVLDSKGERIKIEVSFPRRKVWVQAWKVGVGSVPLYLLDSNMPENAAEDRALTDQLYGGGSDYRLKQEILLGIGGYWMLKALGKSPRVCHMNEGHAAFLVWARFIELVKGEKLDFESAREFIAQTNIFTTHTPVPAGHDVFGVDQIEPFVSLYAEEIGLKPEQLLGLGQLSKHSLEHKCFSMTDLALSASLRVNGVSQVHGRVSREMFQEIYPQLSSEEVPVIGVTNGVHAGTWLAGEWQDYFTEITSSSNWLSEDGMTKLGVALEEAQDDELWALKKSLKRRLVSQVKAHVKKSYPERGEDASNLASALANLHEDALIIGFARRFATYKRATLLFHHVERLEALIDKGYPIVILYAGKAHPRDLDGQAFIKEVVEFSRRPKLQGRVIFIENYEMDIARLLVQGADVWLNTPTRPLEASGTSGMKASMNGTLNLSVDDGWWSEAYNGHNGWLISERALSEDVDFQLKYDSAQIYALLENEVVPAFFEGGIGAPSASWLAKLRASITSTLWEFSTARMLRDYKDRFISDALESEKVLRSSSFEKTRMSVDEQRKVLAMWKSAALGSPNFTNDGDTRVAVSWASPAGVPAKSLKVSLHARREGETWKPVAELALESNAFRTSVALPSKGQWDLALRVQPALQIEGLKDRVLWREARWV